MIPARQRILIIGLIILGILFAGYFGMRSLLAVREFQKHAPPALPAMESRPLETDPDLIRDWMTLPYISVTYDLHPRVLYEVLDIPPQGNEEKSLQELNRKYFPDAPGIVLEIVRAAVRANQPAPNAIPPLTPVPAKP